MDAVKRWGPSHVEHLQEVQPIPARTITKTAVNQVSMKLFYLFGLIRFYLTFPLVYDLYAGVMSGSLLLKGIPIV